MYGSKGGNAWKSLPILTEGRRFESCHSEKHTRPVLRYVQSNKRSKGCTIHLLVVTFNSLVASYVRSKVVLPSCVLRSHSEARKKGASSKKQVACSVLRTSVDP